MPLTGLAVFDSTLHETNHWLNELLAPLGTDDRHRAYFALRTVLHALRDRLPPALAVHLGAQLPMLVRGLYYEDWRMASTPTRERHKEEFLATIRQAFHQDSRLDPEIAAQAVFGLLAKAIDHGEVRKVVSALPRELRALWPADAAT